MAYLLDANVFIQAKNLHYGFDFCPAFWDWILENHAASRIFSIEKVGDELTAGSDELATWAAARGAAFFQKPTAATLPALATVSSWVNSQQYDPGAVNTFLMVADYYVVAEALARKAVVVTHEVPAASAKRIKIPNVCIGLDIKCVTPYQMLRSEHARFVLGRPSPSGHQTSS